MPAPAKVHRASALRRRAALLEAAAELAAEIGAGAVTHRAVATRAGLPLSTTSYFFSSIDELVTEALCTGVTERTSDLEAVEQVAASSTGSHIDEVIGDAVAEALSADPNAEGGQVEFYLAAGRQPELRAQASDTVHEYVAMVARQFERTGAVRPEETAWAVAALGDGAMLHRLARVDTDHRARLASGLRLLAAAAMLRDDELEILLARYPFDPSAIAPDIGARDAASAPPP